MKLKKKKRGMGLATKFSTSIVGLAALQLCLALWPKLQFVLFPNCVLNLVVGVAQSCCLDPALSLE